MSVVPGSSEASSPAQSHLLKTPLFKQHQALGAKLVDFAGWELPVQYTGVIEEHCAVRQAVGVFDVSHMGELRLLGAEAVPSLQRLVCNDLGRIKSGRAQYTALLNEQGGVIDDLIVYKISDQELFLCVNASNTLTVWSWLQERLPDSVELRNESAQTGLLAVQGPLAATVLARDSELAVVAELKTFGCQSLVWRGVQLFVARTGYTGEDGFEVFVPWSDTEKLWDFLVAEQGVKPIGLAARDTLRLEVGYPLHGNELSPQVSALESGLAWIVKFDKGFEFCGRSALFETQQALLAGKGQVLVGAELLSAGIARHGDVVISDAGEVVGEVTSGTRSPTLEKSICMVRVPMAMGQVGNLVRLQVRKRILEAQVVKLPFYRRKS